MPVSETGTGGSPVPVVVEKRGDGSVLGRTVLKALPPLEITRVGVDRVALDTIARRGGGVLVETREELAGELARIASEAAASQSKSLVGALALAALAVFLVELLGRAMWRGES